MSRGADGIGAVLRSTHRCRVLRNRLRRQEEVTIRARDIQGRVAPTRTRIIRAAVAVFAIEDDVPRERTRGATATDVQQVRTRSRN